VFDWNDLKYFLAVARGGSTLAAAVPWRLRVDRSTRISCSRSLPTSKSTGRPRLKKCVSPAAYMKICALLVPSEMKVEHAGGVKAMTDDAIVAAIAAIEEMLAQRQAGANAKVIEGEAEVVPSLPAPSTPTTAS
jgi:hypothetical protein